MSSTLFAQTETINRFPFKKATITYKLSGDYNGIRTIYIDDYGTKQADYWKGSYEKRQPGPNERVNFQVHDIFIGKLKYQINDANFSAIVTSNPYYFYLKDAESAQAANEAIYHSQWMQKTDRKEKIGANECTVWHQEIRFLVTINNYLWINEQNIVCKYEFEFLSQLQQLYSNGIATLEKVDFETEIPDSVFSDFPNFMNYQYAESSDKSSNSFDSQVFESDDERSKFEEELKQKGFVVERDIKSVDFKSMAQKFNNQFLNKDINLSHDPESLRAYFPLKEDASGNPTVNIFLEIGTRQNLDQVYIDDYKRSFNHFTTVNHKKGNALGLNYFYLYGTMDENDNTPKTILCLINKNKYLIRLSVEGEKYSQEEMIKMLEKSKILDL